MGRYLSMAPRVKKQQVFTVSGTFTPSPGLLAAGGVVEVRCVGGGGAGGGIYNPNTGSNWTQRKGGGGSGADIGRIVTVTGPVQIIIGAGGSDANGGTTSFGDLVIAPGGKKGDYTGGAAGGLGGFAGEKAQNVTGSGGTFTVGGQGGGAGGGGQNSGGGGAYNESGYSGICIVTWEE